MEKYIGASVMCVISAVFAVLAHMLIVERKKRFIVKNIYFYAVSMYGIMSIAKAAVGEGKKTLFESFADIELATYLHYGIALAAAAALIPAVFRFAFKPEKSRLFIEMFLSVFSFITGIYFLLRGAISSYVYITIGIFSLVLSFSFAFLYKKEVGFYTREKMKQRMLFILPIMLLWTITVVVFEPNQMLLNNLDEFSIPYFSFMIIMIVEGAAVLAVYLLIGVFVLSDRQLKAFGAIIFGISAAGYIQGNFLNGEMLVMDGNVQTWGTAQKLINIIVWLLILAAAVFAVYNRRYKKISSRVVQILCVYICLMQLFSLAFLIMTAEFPKEENEFTLTTNHMFELDKENNVVVFVLDWFDRQIMDDILEQTPDFTKKLKDFTYYTNAASCYAYTSLSVPYMLTQVEWEYGMEAADYCEYAYSNGSLIDDIEGKNYSIGLYTDAAYVGDSAKLNLLNYSNETVKKLGYRKAFYVMNDTSKYKMAPFAAKQFYFYATEDIDGIMLSSGEYSTNNDVAFHEMLSRDKLSFYNGKNYDGAFRFYHLKGAHALYNMNDNFEEVKENGTCLSQSRGAIKIVYEYIDEMKKLGVYDNAAIIITADHGQNKNVMKESELETDYDMTSAPILFVKLPGERHEDGPINSTAPVSHTDFAATIINAVGGDYSKYGRTFAQIPEDEARERMFTYAYPPNKKYKRYIINGDSNNPAAWSGLAD